MQGVGIALLSNFFICKFFIIWSRGSLSLLLLLLLLSEFLGSAIGQKGESQNGCFKRTKHVKFSEKLTFLTPDTHTLKHSLLLTVLCFTDLFEINSLRHLLQFSLARPVSNESFTSLKAGSHLPKKIVLFASLKAL